MNIFFNTRFNEALIAFPNSAETLKSGCAFLAWRNFSVSMKARSKNKMGSFLFSGNRLFTNNWHFFSSPFAE